MGNTPSKKTEDTNEHPTVSTLIHRSDVTFKVTTGSESQRLLQIEQVPQGKLTLVIESYPPAEGRYVGTHNRPVVIVRDSRALSTEALDIFRATHESAIADPKVEAFLLMYNTLRINHDRKFIPGKPKSALSRWADEWVVDPAVEDQKQREEDQKEDLRDAIIEHFGPAVQAIHAQVPQLAERLLHAMGTPSMALFSTPESGNYNPALLQTATRIIVDWEKTAKGSRTPEAGRSKTASPDISQLRIDTPGPDETCDVLDSVAEVFKADLQLCEETINRAANATLYVFDGAVMYDVNPPFSLTHLSSLCARLLHRVYLYIKDPQLRLSLLLLIFDAVFLGLTMRTPGLASLWIDVNITKIAHDRAAPKDVIELMTFDLAAVGLCLLKLTSKHMQVPLPSPNPAIIHRLANLQPDCRMAACKLPFIGPEGHLNNSATFETSVVIQPAVFPPDVHIQDTAPSFRALCGIYTLTMYEGSREIVTALARWMELVHANEEGPKRFNSPAMGAFKALQLMQDDYGNSPEFKDVQATQ